MKLYLARHAETNYNILKLCNADPTVDVHLSEHGIEQAKELAELLKDADFEVIYVSGLPRTKETADYVSKHHDCKIIRDIRLNDNKTGFEGKPVADFMQAISSSQDTWNAKFNDGESLNEAAQRASEFIDELKLQNYKSALIVTHGFIVESIFAKLESKTLQEASEFNLPQGTFAEFEI